MKTLTLTTREHLFWKTMTVTALTAAAIFCLSSIASADFETGLRAFEEQRYADAAAEWRVAAQAGNSRAQHNLGVLYDEGLGVEQNALEAAKWYQQAAENGVPGAAFNLGAMYDEGYGVEQDFAEAAKWYRAAADAGVVDAQFNLGLLYAIGQGVPQDYEKAYYWVSLASAAKDVSFEHLTACYQVLEELAPHVSSAGIKNAETAASTWWANEYASLQ
ncbi:tetratricopeptide repeat protein [Desulfovibrio inopinatus]|uniref:tetratricopeptide repeat protein n=1 Tax=Desulfovibrio inopinatus TaxID=102109 RepID=UPI00041A6662|nr:tetratricopeptide repeat protein [Desulfovibrio inopinatus]